MSPRKRIVFVLLAAGAPTALASCPGLSDYTTPLPNNYALVRVHSGASGIVDRNNRFVVGPSSVGILLAVVGDVIVGNLDTEESAVGVPEIPDRYFVVDTLSGEVRAELSETEYRQVLVEIGLNPPSLVRPDRFTRFAE